MEEATMAKRLAKEDEGEVKEDEAKEDKVEAKEDVDKEEAKEGGMKEEEATSIKDERWIGDSMVTVGLHHSNFIFISGYSHFDPFGTLFFEKNCFYVNF